MTLELRLAYAAYLLWLLAGLGDFVRHWRTDLPHTSGLAESAAHLVQLALLGMAVTLGLAFEMGRTLAWLLLLLVSLHAIVGYLDARIAFTRHRVVSPVEQHLHSVLDMAPIIAFAWLLASTWPMASGDGWRLEWRRPALPLAIWAAALVPALVLTVVPAVLEFRASWKAARRAA